MIFVYPSILLLLILAPVLAFLGFRAKAGGTRRWLVAGLRFAAVTAVVLALARPMLRVSADKATQVVVIDLSPGVSAAAVTKAREEISRAQERGGDLRVIAFSNRAELVEPSVLAADESLTALRQRLSAGFWSDDPQGGGSNLASALQLAAAQIPPDGRGQVQLCSNGLSNHGDAAAESYRLARRGIAVNVTPLDVAAKDTIVVRKVTVPASARIGESVPAEVEVESQTAGTAKVTLTAGEGNSATATVAVVPGINKVHLSLPLRNAGLTQVTAAVALDNGVAEASLAAAIDVGAPTKIVLVESGNDTGIKEAMSALLGKSAQIETISPAALANEALGNVGAVVLADLPAEQLPAASQTALRNAVTSGTGLLIAGAARSFGPGGYEDSQLASILPVRMPQQMESIDPSTTLVLCIDTSGSMSGNRIDLAKEVARLAISHLRPHDKVGIVEFYGGKRWAAPIQSASNTAVIARALNRLTASGGTTMYPAVEEAAFGLRSITTRSKHVVVLSDGIVENAPFAPLIRQMVEDGISVSSVLCGPASGGMGGKNMMPDMARWGRGRFYSVPDQYSLPDLTLKQPQISLLSPIVETPTALVAGSDSLVRGADVASWGPVNSYVRTVAKSTADTILKTAGGDPLLVRWRYGAGFVAAMPTQLGSTMTKDIQNNPAFAGLMADLFRQVGGARGDKLTVKPTARPAGIEVAISTVDPDPALATKPVIVTFSDDQGKTLRTVTAQPTAPGQWNILLPGVTAGAYQINAGLADVDNVRGKAGIAIAAPREVAALSADNTLLSSIAGFGQLATERAAALPAKGVVFLELQKALAVSGVLLILLHIAARRWPAGGR